MTSIDRKPLLNGLSNIIQENINAHDLYGTNITTHFLRKYNAIPFKEDIANDVWDNFNGHFNALVSLYGEICTTRELIKTVGIDKEKIIIIEEREIPTPDIQVELNGKKIYFEVYTPILQEVEKDQTQDELIKNALKVKTFRQFRHVELDSKKIIVVMTIGKINLLVWSNPLTIATQIDNNPLDYSNIDNVLLSYEPNDNEYVIVYGCPFVEGCGTSKIWCNDTDMKMKELSIDEFKSII